MVSGLVLRWLDDSFAEACAGAVGTHATPSRILHRSAANGWLDNEPAVSRLITHLNLEADILLPHPMLGDFAG